MAPSGIASEWVCWGRFFYPAQAYCDLDPDCLGCAPEKAILELMKLIGIILGLAELEDIPPRLE